MKGHDPFGAAAVDYYQSRFNWKKNIIVKSSLGGEEKIRVEYLFRNLKGMPEIEKTAINMCSGKTLDVGACVGSHSLELQKRNINVDALEISPECCRIMKQRGVKNVICSNIYDFNEGKYDTIVLLMNGIGIAGTINGLRKLLHHLKKILSIKGQIIFDSSDIDYAYHESDGSKWLDLNNEYYGQVRYKIRFKKIESEEFNWLFIDKDKMSEVAAEEGFKFSILGEGNHYDYLGILKPQ